MRTDQFVAADVAWSEPFMRMFEVGVMGFSLFSNS